MQQYLYAAIGPKLICFEPRLKSCALVDRGSIKFDLNIQYIWPHSDKRTIYLALSDGGPGTAGEKHEIQACEIDGSSGAVRLLGAPQAVPFRPLHLCTDKTGTHLLVACNNPSALIVHKLNTDGSVGSQTSTNVSSDTGIFGHQVMVMPDGKSVILVCRGYDASEIADEQPGSLQVFDYHDGELTLVKSIKPEGGFGFGARHLDFHPNAKWLYLTVERQNEIHVFYIGNGQLSETPLYRVSTLSRKVNLGARQASSAIRVAASGNFVYVSNRTYGRIETMVGSVIPSGEDNIAVFKIDHRTGEPTPIQHIDTQGSLPRTFSIHASGKMLVAANSEAATKINSAGVAENLPLSLIIYHVSTNGILTERQRIKFPEKKELLFWAGFL
ncbi:MAG: hypothetical protein CMM58_05880 [Rhodospirillaceae bacterium]|nr:hypothetical protein [Rhodospirillaceae bacterium]|tara:strand:+ start:2809 stop:3963 length:1155 start_codon:yes stop_codon:yes gene_type:complete